MQSAGAVEGLGLGGGWELPGVRCINRTNPGGKLRGKPARRQNLNHFNLRAGSSQERTVFSESTTDGYSVKRLAELCAGDGLGFPWVVGVSQYNFVFGVTHRDVHVIGVDAGKNEDVLAGPGGRGHRATATAYAGPTLQPLGSPQPSPPRRL